MLAELYHTQNCKFIMCRCNQTFMHVFLCRLLHTQSGGTEYLGRPSTSQLATVWTGSLGLLRCVNLWSSSWQLFAFICDRWVLILELLPHSDLQWPQSRLQHRADGQKVSESHQAASLDWSGMCCVLNVCFDTTSLCSLSMLLEGVSTWSCHIQ